MVPPEAGVRPEGDAAVEHLADGELDERDVAAGRERPVEGDDDPQRADHWLSEPNTAPLFGCQTALQRMLGGNVSDLFVVRQYLDAQRGGKA